MTSGSPLITYPAYDLPVSHDEPLADLALMHRAAEQSVGRFVVVAALVSAVCGVALTFAYRPHEFGWLRVLHAGSGAIAVISAVAARVVGRGGRLRLSGRGIALGVLLVVVLGGLLATGSSLAWNGGAPDDRGMLIGPGHQVRVGNSSVGRGSLIAGLALHAALGVCAFVLLAGRYVRSWWTLHSNRR